jgi:FkbM family methyltransferase
MATGQYEQDFTKAFLNELATHDSVIDIGANIGFYTCLAAVHDKRVTAVEPLGRNLDYLLANLWANRMLGVEVYPIGLGKIHGIMPIYGFGGIASFVKDWAQAPRSRFSIAPVNTLDAILSGRSPEERLLIKVDVEGFEADVLAGAIATLDRRPKPTWMVEIFSRYEGIPGGVNTQFCDTFDYFWRHGYKCKKVNATGEAVTEEDVKNWATSGSAELDTSNFLFFAGERTE